MVGAAVILRLASIFAKNILRLVQLYAIFAITNDIYI